MVARHLALLALFGCPRAAEVNDCLEEDCPPCVEDDECVLAGNPCLDTVHCTHVDHPVAVEQIGCSAAQERRWPPPETCACIQSTCQSSD